MFRHQKSEDLNLKVRLYYPRHFKFVSRSSRRFFLQREA